MRRLGYPLLVAGFTLAALNLRPALAGISPLLGDIMADLRLSPGAAGMISTVMVVCLGLLAPIAPVLAARAGLDRALLAGLIVLAVGLVIRSAGGPIMLYLGAVACGTAIAVMNVVMPALVKRHFRAHVGLITGVYVTGLVAGAAAGAALAIPAERAIGHGWRPAAAVWVVLAVVAAALWLPQATRNRATASDGRAPLTGRLPRGRTTWLVTAYMGLQSMTFYVTLTWLPTIFRDAGMPADHAGYLLGLSNLVQVAATLTVPVHAGRSRTQVPHVTAAAVLTILGYLGVLLAPGTVPWLWMVLLGLGQGASIALALLIITLRAPDPDSVASLSAVAQAFGYVFAAAGPFLIGLLRAVSGGWGVPLLAGLAACTVQLLVGLWAGHPAAAR